MPSSKKNVVLMVLAPPRIIYWAGHSNPADIIKTITVCRGGLVVKVSHRTATDVTLTDG